MDVPSKVLEQVEALFNVIEQLPLKVGDKALLQIHKKLASQLEHRRMQSDNRNEIESTITEQRDEEECATSKKHQVVPYGCSKLSCDTSYGKNGDKIPLCQSPVSPLPMEKCAPLAQLIKLKSCSVVLRRIDENHSIKQSLGTAELHPQGTEPEIKISIDDPTTSREVCKTEDLKTSRHGLRRNEERKRPFWNDESYLTDFKRKRKKKLRTYSGRSFKLKRKKKVKTDPELNEEPPYTCKVCSELITTKIGQQTHVCAHASDKLFICNICCKSFSNQSHLQNHVDRHDRFKLIRKNKAKRDPELKEEPPYTCKLCSELILTKKYQETHLCVNASNKLYKCNICCRKFSNQSYLNIHMERHNRAPNLKCDQCDYTCHIRAELQRHKQTHSGEKNFQCTICGFLLRSKKRLMMHYQQKHEPKQRYICQQCGYCTHMEENLNRHIKTKHTNNELIECPVCHKMLRLKWNFIAHMRQHTGGRPHKCQSCDMAFKRSSELTIHRRIHSEKTEQCSTCLRRFKTKEHLQKHEIVHTNAKSFFCPICPYACRYRHSVNKHVRCVHNMPDFSYQDARSNDLKNKKTLIDKLAKKMEETTAVAFLTNISITNDENITGDNLKKVEEQTLCIPESSVEESNWKSVNVEDCDTTTGNDGLIQEIMLQITDGETDVDVVQNMSATQQEGTSTENDSLDETALLPSNKYIILQSENNEETFCIPIEVTDTQQSENSTVFVLRCIDGEVV